MGYAISRHRKLLRLICGGTNQKIAGRAVGMSHPGAQRVWSRYGGPPLKSGQGGGIATLADFDKSGGPNQPLSYEERVVIMLGLDFGMAKSAIADKIGRHRSVVGREIRRNISPQGKYDASVAHAWAAHRARRPKEFKLLNHPLAHQISNWIEDGWSPKLIAEMMGRLFADDRGLRVSHETIYQCLYVQTRGSLRADLAKRLSTRRTARKPRDRVSRRGNPYAEAFTISDRPAEVADRAVPGHWEGDLIIGKNSGSAIGTLVERTTRFTILLHLPDCHDADTVAAAMITAMGQLPEHLRRTITWDRGRELAQYRKIQLELGATVYFCDPHSPWQRGTNENTNRLLRHWFTKGTDLSVHDTRELRRVQDLLNTRPRPTLGFDTPADRLRQLIDGDVARTA